jgi:uncharacterized protein (DUF885 family)
MKDKYKITNFILTLILAVYCSLACDAGGTAELPAGLATIRAETQSIATVKVTSDPPVVQSSVDEIIATLEGMTLDDFFEASYRRLLLRSPERISDLGMAEDFGLRNDKLDNISDAYIRETQKLQAAILDLLRTYDRAEISPEQRISFDVYEWILDDLVRGQEFMYFDYLVHHFLGSYHDELIRLLTEYHTLATKQDAEDYVSRLSQVDDQVGQLMEGLALREESGVIPPTYIIDMGRSEMMRYLQLHSPDPSSVDVEQLSVFTYFKEGLEEIDDLSSGEKQDLLDAAVKEIEESFIPAYVEILNYLDYLRPLSTNEAGVWKFPNGDEYYAYILRSQTTSELTPQEIHEIGLAEVARIQTEFRELFDELGYPSDESLGASMSRAIRDGGSYDISTLVGKDEFISATEALIEEADQQVGVVFDLRPSRDVVVIGGPIGGYYVSGTADGSRPGAYHISISGTSRPKYYMPSAAYHEAIPGHHFQIAIAQEMDLPLFRNDIVLNAYAEGWALYAERLAWELGLYDDNPYGNAGRLQLELLRAVRLVADTGIHALRWTREEAKEYMIEALGDPYGIWTHEVDRYIVLPAQATGYMIGMIKILELRQLAMDELGDQFDLKEFHNVVLGNGGVPLGLLERAVHDYIDDILGPS